MHDWILEVIVLFAFFIVAVSVVYILNTLRPKSKDEIKKHIEKFFNKKVNGSEGFGTVRRYEEEDEEEEEEIFIEEKED